MEDQARCVIKWLVVFLMSSPPLPRVARGAWWPLDMSCCQQDVNTNVVCGYWLAWEPVLVLASRARHELVTFSVCGGSIVLSLDFLSVFTMPFVAV